MINIIIVRQYTQNNISHFRDKLAQINWDSVLSCLDCQAAYTTYYNLYKTCYDSCFPICKIKINSYPNMKQWLTPALKESIKIKNKLYLRSRRSPTTDNWNNYKVYRNKLHGLSRRVERNHYELLFNPFMHRTALP